MEYHITEKNFCTIISIRGSFERTAVYSVPNIYPILVGKRKQDLVLDLSHMECSRGELIHATGFISRLCREADIHSCCLHLGSLPRNLDEYLKNTGTDRIFNLHSGTDEAVRILSHGDSVESTPRTA